MEILFLRKEEEAYSPFIFPSRNATPSSDMALTKALRGAKVQSDTPTRVATAHGFRSSFRDWASENGYSRDIAERALVHTIKNAARPAYSRTDLLGQRREMMAAIHGKVVLYRAKPIASTRPPLAMLHQFTESAFGVRFAHANPQMQGTKLRGWAL